MAINSSRDAALACCLLLSGSALAQTAPMPLPPMPLPMPAEIAAPRDIPYPGALRVDVDATDVGRHIFNVRETIAVQGGQPLTLLYPKWLPGHHSPVGRIDALAGLIIKAGGTRLE